jgi:hypothetical protein
MSSHGRSPAEAAANDLVSWLTSSWLTTAALGPAGVALPVNWAAGKLAGAAVRWFRRCRQTDDLSRLVRAAAGPSAQLSRDEIKKLANLLEDEETWRQLSGSDVNDLTGRVATCLSSDARMAADAIARGLLEFAVFDLQPDVFQRVVQARLRQMTGQVSALDEALFRIHEDLYQLVDEVKDLFGLVSDRLPAGPANLREIKIYLNSLIDWLNTDPWPRHLRLGGPVLTPAAIERKLRVAATGAELKHDADADELARRCSRLVILGGPGSGKTWLAMRTARICAEEALKGLEDDALLDDVELPLYTTCSRLISTPGDIREAVVTSALNWMGDLGGSRIIKALSLAFTQRTAKTLLVIDSLDEVGDDGEARDRLRRADSLKPAWRVMLTSRPGSWDHQLNIEGRNRAHQVGELEPLRYPEDVNQVIKVWFDDRLEAAAALTIQIAKRPDLQRTATVPLMLAFYCILGGEEPLPETWDRDDGLFAKVLNRLLAGCWHANANRVPPGPWLGTLRSWAWDGAVSDAFSGLGAWPDKVSTRRSALGENGNKAVDHIAVPTEAPDVDDGKVPRRFIHRQLREYLVASYVAGLDAKRAAEVLLPHLWFDPDWEYAAPAALAMHPDRGQVLCDLIRRAARPAETPEDFAGIDVCWEFSRFLARVASVSRRECWPDEAAEIIGRARVKLATSGVIDDLGGAPSWEESNCEARKLLFLRYRYPLHFRPYKTISLSTLIAGLTRLATTQEARQEARAKLLGMLGNHHGRSSAFALARGVIGLSATVDEKRQVLDTLLMSPELIGEPEPGPPMSRRGHAADVYLISQLAETEVGKSRTRGALLQRLATWPQSLPSWGDDILSELIKVLMQLTPSVDEKRQARGTLLSLTIARSGEREPDWAQQTANLVTLLCPTEEDKRQACDALNHLIITTTDNDLRLILARQIARLSPTTEERRQARTAMLRLLENPPTRSDRSQIRLAVPAVSDVSAPSRQIDVLAEQIARLSVTTEEKEEAHSILLQLLPYATAWSVPSLLANRLKLSTTAEQTRQAMEALLQWLEESHRGAREAVSLAALLSGIDIPSQDDHRLGIAILKLLERNAADGHTGNLLRWLNRLPVTTDFNSRIQEVLFKKLSDRPPNDATSGLRDIITYLQPVTTQEKRMVRDAILDQLSRDIDMHKFDNLMLMRLRYLSPTPEDREYVRNRLRGLLDTKNGVIKKALVWQLISQFDPASEDIDQARQAILQWIESTSFAHAGPLDETFLWLEHVLAQLHATPEDHHRIRRKLLGKLGTEAAHEDNKLVGDCLLLAAIRRHSTSAEWITFLSSQRPQQPRDAG